MENKLREEHSANENSEILLDISELKVVNAGGKGMRVWNEEEERLVEKSNARNIKIIRHFPPFIL